jgi:hypothetical protein
MALGSQVRHGKQIGLPWLKHCNNSQPTYLLTNWIPNPFSAFELLIFKDHNHSETTLLLYPSYEAIMTDSQSEFFDRVSLRYAEIEKMRAI